MSKEKIIVYGTVWCGDCVRAKRFFDEHSIEYEWVNIDLDKTAEKFVIETNQGLRIVPTIIFPDGTFLVEPTNKQLVEKFNLENIL